MDFSKLTEAELKEALLLLEKQDGYSTQDECQESFLSYVNHMWPEFVCGRHHQIFAEKLEQVARGEINRLIVNMPPRHTKSEFAICRLTINQQGAGKPIKGANTLQRVWVEL
jgi:hypothetical protein